MNRIKMATVSMAAAMMMTLGPVAEPVTAQVVVGGGLVNLQIGSIDVETGDILSENTTQVNLGVALQLAANVCDVSVNVLAQQLKDGGAYCEAVAEGGEADFANISR